MIDPKDRQNALIFARVFSVLSDPNRLLILKILKEKEKSVSQIAIEMNQSQPLVSHHLASLKSAGLVKSKKEGNFVFYSLASEKIGEVIESLDKMLEDIVKEMDNIPFPQAPMFFIGRGRRGRKWM